MLPNKSEEVVSDQSMVFHSNLPVRKYISAEINIKYSPVIGDNAAEALETFISKQGGGTVSPIQHISV